MFKRAAVANEDTAKEGLKSISFAQQLYSIQRGGGGKTEFATGIHDIREGYPAVFQRATIYHPDTADSAKPLDGYVFRLSSKSTPEYYRLEAAPAPGFVGDKFELNPDGYVTKDSLDDEIWMTDRRKKYLNPEKVKSTAKGLVPAGAVVGGLTGMLIDRRKRLRGLLIGSLIGSALGIGSSFLLGREYRKVLL